MRRVRAGVVAAVVGLASLTAVPAAAFPDVPYGAYYRDAVQWLVDAGITTGVGNTGEFRPDDPVTRAQMATFLWRLRDRPPAPPHRFVDVPRDSYFNDAVSWLAHSGVTTGVGGSNRFEPHEIVTRAQMAAFLHRLAGLQGGAPHHGFPDVPGGVYYDGAVSWLKHRGITTGVGNTGLYQPYTVVTRGQMAAFMYRLATNPSAWNKSGTWVFGPGTFHVGSQVPPGTYRTRANRDGCYWERLSGFSGEFHHLITNDYRNTPATVQISPSDRGFHATEGCGTWTRISG
jgi:hypothetical protein